MKARIFATLIVLGLAGATWAAIPSDDATRQPAPATASPPPPPTPRYRSVTHVVADGDTAGSILRRMDAGGEAFLAGAGRALDRLGEGDRLHLDFRDGEPAPWRLRLESDAPEVVEITRETDGFVTRKRPVPYSVHEGVRTLVVTSSLWEAAVDGGLSPGRIAELSRIFEYDIDFNTELRAGATFRLVGETLVDDAGAARFGSIQAARLTNGGKPLTAIRYVLKDGTVGWFAPDGTGRRRPFLRSPLEFSRVTSNFSLARYHPILKTARPHLGVDFGAPTGTPVRAVADAVVEKAGRNGGHGNFIQLDHEGPYATSYSHLSSILVRRGQKVRQGEVIGRVGSTGMSTGPHLHYQFFVNGQYRNPMTVELPMTGSLPDDERASFQQVVASVLPRLDAPEAEPATGDEGSAASAAAE